MKFIVKTQFHDAKSLRVLPEGAIIEWEDADRIEAAIKRGLIEEIKEKKSEDKPKAPAKKKTASKKK